MAEIMDPNLSIDVAYAAYRAKQAVEIARDEARRRAESAAKRGK